MPWRRATSARASVRIDLGEQRRLLGVVISPPPLCADDLHAGHNEAPSGLQKMTAEASLGFGRKSRKAGQAGRVPRNDGSTCRNDRPPDRAVPVAAPRTRRVHETQRELCSDTVN